MAPLANQLPQAPSLVSAVSKGALPARKTAALLSTCFPVRLAGFPSVLLLDLVLPRVDQLPHEELLAQGAPGVLGVAAVRRESVGLDHTAVGKRVDLGGEGEAVMVSKAGCG